LAATAKARYLRVSARKVRYLADLIRGLSLAEAQQQLKAVHRPSAGVMLRRLLDSALNNANQAAEGRRFDAEELIVGTIDVDAGPLMKRFQPRAMGRAAPIRKRTAHVTVKLYESA